MLYCIYHEGTLNGWRVDIGKERNFVEQMVHAYLRGKSKIIISGITYSVGSQIFQIYKVPSEHIDEKSLIKSIEDISSGNINNRLLSELFQNVTNEFLFGREFGELKEDYFNIYINDGIKKPILTVLTKNEVINFLNEFGNGNNSIWVGGRAIDLENPKTIKIFNIELKWLSKDRGEIRNSINKMSDVLGKWSVEVIKSFGNEVTEDFDVRPFGSTQTNKGLQNKDVTEIPSSSVSKKTIFVSHSSKDKKIIDEFVQKILRLGLEITKGQIFCTSIEGMGIQTGEDFRNKIGIELKSSSIVIIMLSGFYKKSEICQNEMGAAWVLNKKVIPIIIPPLQYNEVGALHITDHLDRIDNASNLDNIIHTLQNLLDLKLDDVRNLNKQRDEFLQIFNTSED